MRLIILLGIVLYSCNTINHKELPAHKQTKASSDRSRWDKEYYSYYGFVVNNSDERSFYCVDKEIMLKYIEDFQDTVHLKTDLKKANWYGELRGRSFDSYAFGHFLSDYDFQSVILNYCDKDIKSKVIPVYLTEFAYVIQTKLNKLKPCENKIAPLPYKTFSRPSLNVTNITPLPNELRLKFLDIKDTLNRQTYLDYIYNPQNIIPQQN